MDEGLVDSAARRAGILLALLVCCAGPRYAAGADNIPPPDLTGDTGRGSSPDLPALAAPKLPAIRLLLFDPTGALPEATATTLGDEVETIFRGLGVELSFSLAAPETVYGEGSTLEIPAIVLHDDPVPARRNLRVMGLVVRDQKPIHAVWAFLRNVRVTLGHGRVFGPVSAAEERGLGLALGRVIAHEIIHAIAPDEPHARNGLMSHSLDRAFLLGRRAQLDARCGRAFLGRLVALLPPPPEAPEIAAEAAFLSVAH